MFVGYTGLIGIALALHRLAVEKALPLTTPIIAALAIGLLLGIFLFGLVVRNRAYFVQVMRYINEHRGFFLNSASTGFLNNSGMYTDHRYPKFFNYRSSHAWFLYILATLNGTLLAVILGILCPLRTCGFVPILAALLVLPATQLAAAIAYLRSREGKQAEAAIFRQKSTDSRSTGQ